jgi:hypothetical protein
VQPTQRPDVPFQATDFGAGGMQPLAQRAMGQAPSPAALQQAMQMGQLRQQQAAMAGAPMGGNPALAQLRAAGAATSPAMGLMAQGAQSRLQEQTMAQRALMEAQFRQRQLQLQEAEQLNQHLRQLEAARMAQHGTMIAGLSGAVNTAMTSFGGRGGGQQAAQ